MEQRQKCLADQIYEDQQKNPGKKKNTSAAGDCSALIAYCVDGAKLYCTMGSSSALLRVEDHGLRLNGKAAAHDGDTTPNKNIFPFGNCKLKKNDPCASPAPVGRWLLSDEYAVIGSCYVGKVKQFGKARGLMDKARKALEAINHMEFLLRGRNMMQMDSSLRKELYQALRVLRRQKEELALFSVCISTDPAEAVDYLESMQNSAKLVKNTMDMIRNVLDSPEDFPKTLQKEFLNMFQLTDKINNESALNGYQNFYESMMRKPEDGTMAGLGSRERATYKQSFGTIGAQAEKLAGELKSLSEEGKTVKKEKSGMLGYQLTMNSIIPCQIGGLIHF